MIPTRGRPGLVMRAVDSVLAQTHEALEVIVVIDGPDPATVRALLACGDHRLRHVQLLTSQGAGPARNRGAALAGGTWIAFLDDDDEWLPDKLARQLAAAGGREVIATCRSIVRSTAGEEVWPRTLYRNQVPVDEYLFDRRTLFRGDAHLGTSTLLLPTRLFTEHQFSRDRQNEDTSLLLRITKQAGIPVVMVQDPLVVLHKGDDRESLGSRYDWREMLRWVDGMGGLVTRRAYSGFCLIYLGSQAARRGDWPAFPVLLGRAFSRGAPRLMHVLPFLGFWLLRPSLRVRLRRAWRRAPAC